MRVKHPHRIGVRGIGDNHRVTRLSNPSSPVPDVSLLPFPSPMSKPLPSPSASASALCLACSGCIPAREQPTAFRTPCCARPVCAACAATNPRLLRYDPCLACLAGVRAVAVAAQGRLPPPPTTTTTNLDGALRDADVFVLGDEEEEDDDDVRGAAGAGPPRTPPPAYRETDAPAPPAPDAPAERPGTHRIQREDTLRGLALKYAVDGRALCRLNGLPPSTLSTTPHLLHTRAVLLLPPHAHAPAPALPRKDAPGASSSSSRALECAAARLQRVTHEADPRVARAYVALASSPSRSPSPSPPPPGEKEKQGNDSADSPADRAVRAYRADAAWEASERAAGRGPPSSSSSRATPAPALWARRR
ncbi:hypothetical protein DFH11DRAFT_1884045 [Phellopilus nigrolimitatus]|nr:hypothetical protein DFH11DRAFT_1884045 [Phellopilus nigrolimitatus]